jgi:DNA (cytosine-5)-methyltransferase 1
MARPSIASFFAGIGGFDLGFEQAGFKVKFQCEINTFCREVLEYHWPSLTAHEDITTLESSSIPECDVWCGGFPCQDLSVASGGSNGRHGLKGARSGLFFQLARLANEKKPKVILIENVHGLLNANQGHDFAELLTQLSSLGYSVSWRLLNSRYFGVPQSRPRMYICAWANNPIAAANSLFETCQIHTSKNEREGFLTTSSSGVGPIAPRLAFCLAATSGRHTGTDWSRTYIPYANKVRRLTPLECERLQGFPDNWTRIEKELTDIERSDSLRYHALGNAVSVVVVKWIASKIKKELKTNDISSSVELNGNSFINYAISNWPAFSGKKMISGSLSSIRKTEGKIVWPNAGLLNGDIFVSSSIPPSISTPIQSDLIDLVERSEPDQRYFLSSNAAEGILRRVDSQNRHLFPPLRRALEELSGRSQATIVRTNEPSPEIQAPLNLDMKGLACA